MVLESWKESKKKHPLPVKQREFYLITVSAAIGASVSGVMSYVDIEAHPFFKIPLIDYLIYTFIMAIIFVIIVHGVIWFYKLIERAEEFVKIIWKKKEITQKIKGVFKKKENGD